ncbi:YceI family protein [Sphingobium sp. AN558]|uniref:YceI family protein n=1 Tax=Sphingobium sp. AN558 TaxID=3133442 RepID=UPI0030BC00EB
MRRLAQLTLLSGMMALVPAAAVSQEASLYTPGRYQVDATATKAHFHVKALVSSYEGDFVAPGGSVAIEESHPDRAIVDIRFPVDRLTTGDASTDAMLKGDSFFDMTHFPTVRFEATDAPLASAHAATPIAGQLTMHGQTHPVTVSIRLIGVTPDEARGPSMLHFAGTLTVDRSQFGMGFGRPFVSDRVDLTIDALFHRS